MQKVLAYHAGSTHITKAKVKQNNIAMESTGDPLIEELNQGFRENLKEALLSCVAECHSLEVRALPRKAKKRARRLITNDMQLIIIGAYHMGIIGIDAIRPMIRGLNKLLRKQ